MTSEWGYSEEGLKHYTARRTSGPIVVDGRLDEASWKLAARSPRFEDLEEPGRPALFDTRAAVLWDDDYMYVGFWVEEPDIQATYTERDSMICAENDVEVFIAGKDTYYEFELNALGTIMERFYVWQDAYLEGGYNTIPEFDLQGTDLVDTLGGTKTGHAHPRGRRWVFREWDMPGMKWAVHLDGTINDPRERDRGWTAEIAFPWQGLKHLADGRSLPAREGDTWRMDFSRFQWIDEGGYRTCPGWAWNSHGIYDSHIPDRFSVIHFTEKTVGEGERQGSGSRAAGTCSEDAVGEKRGEPRDRMSQVGETPDRAWQKGALGSEICAAPTGTVRYMCRRTRENLVVDGRLDEETWTLAERSPVFNDQTGARPLFDTRAALAWDERGLYVGCWLEDRDIQSAQASRDEASHRDGGSPRDGGSHRDGGSPRDDAPHRDGGSPRDDAPHEVRQDSHVSVIITGHGAYYDLAVNPLGATSEMFYVWKEAYRDDDRFHVPEFDLAAHRPEVLGGHTRTDIGAMRWTFSDWKFPGLQAGVRVDGDPGRRDHVDRGWSVELALPWEGFRWLADSQAATPGPGDVWRVSLIRRQVIDQRGHRWQATWTWQPLDLVDGLMPETHLEVELAE